MASNDHHGAWCRINSHNGFHWLSVFLCDNQPASCFALIISFNNYNHLISAVTPPKKPWASCDSLECLELHRAFVPPGLKEDPWMYIAPLLYASPFKASLTWSLLAEWSRQHEGMSVLFPALSHAPLTHSRSSVRVHYCGRVWEEALLE